VDERRGARMRPSGRPSGSLFYRRVERAPAIVVHNDRGHAGREPFHGLVGVATIAAAG
jgi:hypothetical protein